MTYTATVRQRGQITIPDKIRSELPWLAGGSVIHIFPIDGKSFVVKPYQHELQKKVDWKKVWQMIRLTRSFKSMRSDVSASQFVIKDRQRH
ncbi:MAG: hypothetical protein UY64_C0050G0003 [Parcubacteria group bacterium GW2011_GWA1_51_12]|nr:MAG: hypothetical protein UY64_C0050G0003 [Parcubacteria group bacterium GW2011_GWA1_51_12]